MLSASGRKMFRSLVPSLTQDMLVPTDGAVVVEVVVDDVVGDDVQEPTAIPLRATANVSSIERKKRDI